jgi:succinyl-CoA synthetase beta subunit
MHYLERAATQAGITYTKLEGSINVMSNGCGTGMAVMDYIAQVGGSCSAVTDFGGKTYHE